MEHKSTVLYSRSSSSRSLAPVSVVQYHDEYQQHSDAGARPSLGFPLGTALLLIVIFSLSGIFSCCYHWDKLRSLRRRRAHSVADHLDVIVHHDQQHPSDSTSPSKPTPNHKMMGKQEMKSESVTVIMPGDEIPKFIALPCRCQPPRPHRLPVLLDYPPKPPSTATSFPGFPPYV